MDERTKSEFYKINQEKFFVSAVIIAVFLIIKISLQVGILGMLGEITAAAVIIIYLIPYFVTRYKYKVIDEMVKKKLYKLSSAFFIVEMLSMLPVIAINLAIILGQINRFEPVNATKDSSFPFIIALGFITNVYGLIKMHNDKFVTKKAAEIPLSKYKRKLLIKTIIANAVMVCLVIALIVVNYFISGKSEPDSELMSRWSVWYSSGTLVCILGIPTCWLLYFYFLGTRKKLEKKIEPKSTDET